MSLCDLQNKEIENVQLVENHKSHLKITYFKVVASVCIQESAIN